MEQTRLFFNGRCRECNWAGQAPGYGADSEVARRDALPLLEEQHHTAGTKDCSGDLEVTEN